MACVRHPSSVLVNITHSPKQFDCGDSKVGFVDPSSALFFYVIDFDMIDLRRG